MPSRSTRLRSLAGALLLGCVLGGSLPAAAKPVTIGDITLDVPDSFEAAESDRGVRTKTADDEVFVWWETYIGKESDALIAEHEKYWDKHEVKGGDSPTETTGKMGDLPFSKTDYVNATWKGKPTVLRYFQVGPIGPQEEYVLVTLWASPEGDKSRSDDVATMFNSLNVKIKQ